jgi:hypothetical protein
MSDAISDFDLRVAWRRLRMVGDFDTSMRHSAVRRVMESAARAMQLRDHCRGEPYPDNKSRAANDTDR